MHHLMKTMVAVVMLSSLLQGSSAWSLSRAFRCFFDSGSATVTARCEQIIAEFAMFSAEMERLSRRQDRIIVEAHTDRREDSMALSNQRALAVTSLLLTYGVPAERITTEFFGATRPLVPTAANVREPQNRRVEMILH